MIPATIVCALACVILVIGEYLDHDRMRWLAKPIASLAFIAVGVLAARGNAHVDEFQLAVIAGLIFGAIGDVALLSAHGFLAGLGSFLLGHLAYVVAVAMYLPFDEWPGDAGTYAVIPALVGLGVLAGLWNRLGKLRTPVVLYVLVIIAMVIGAIALYVGGVSLELRQREMFLAGAVLFFISDLAVARDKFVAKGFVNRVWGLPVYYAAQLLIAWSLRS